MTGRTERMLLDDVEKLDWYGLRAPASGARPEHDAGDLWIARKWSDGRHLSTLCIIEEKYSSSTTKASRYIQEDGEKLDAMIKLAEEIGAIPVFAVRWSTRTDWSPGSTHYCIDAREVERTASGNVSLKPERAEQVYEPAYGFFE